MAGGRRIGWGAGLALAAGLAISVGGAFAQADMAQAVQARQAHFKAQGAAFKALLTEIRKAQPDAAAISTSADKLKELASQLPSWFPEGSGPESGVKTAAKPEVWSEPSEFREAAGRFQSETAKLDQLAMAGDVEGVKGETRALAAACKACHDKFRAADDS
jgi:cytochrome c556